MGGYMIHCPCVSVCICLALAVYIDSCLLSTNEYAIIRLFMAFLESCEPGD